MAVVRDITIDQLIQAVTGISTSGMSDSTGQAIKNSIDALTTALTTELRLLRKSVTVTVSSGQTGAQSTGVARNKIVSLIPIYSDDFFYDPVITTLTANSEIEVRTTKGTAVTAQRSYTFDVVYTAY